METNLARRRAVLERRLEDHLEELAALPTSNGPQSVLVQKRLEALAERFSNVLGFESVYKRLMAAANSGEKN